MNVQILILILIILYSLALIFINRKVALYLLILLSLLLHKEFFSIYRWDFLPIRFFMVAFNAFIGFSLLFWLHKTRNLIIIKNRIFEVIKDPFVILLSLVWIVRGVSIYFSQNVVSSLFLFAFFTTIYILGLYLYIVYLKTSEETEKFINFYFITAFLASLFGYLQVYLYYYYDLVIGAFWSIPGKIPRVGSSFWDVNHFGGLLGLLLPVLGTFIISSKKNIHRFLYSLMFIPMFGILFLTGSRSSWLIAVVAFAVFLLILFVRKFRLKGLAIFLTIISLVGLGIFYEYNIKDSPFRAFVRDYFNYRIDSFDSHFLLLEGTFQVFEQFPILGGGYGGFFEHFLNTEAAPKYFSKDPAGLNIRVPPHTTWGEAFAETGIIGAGVFILLMALILITPLYVALTNNEFSVWPKASGMASAIAGVYVAGIFYSYNSEFFWLILFLYFIYSVKFVGEKDYLEKIMNIFVKNYRAGLIFVLTISTFLIFVNLSNNHLLPWDEAIYSKVAKNIVTSGEFMTLSWRPEEFWFEKPPLYMWLTAVSFNIFGINEFAARFFSALFGLLTILVVYLFAEKLFSKTSAFISALSLLTTFHFLYYSRAAMLDVTVTFFITLTLYLYYLYRTENKPWHFVFVGIALGLAVMTKNVIGLIALPIIGLYDLYLLVSKQQKLSKEFFISYISMILSFLFVTAPWHIAMWLKHKEAFLNSYIGYHVLQRAVEGIEDKGQPFYWYLIVLRVSMRIWFVVLLLSYPFTFLMSFIKKKEYLFLIIWSLFIFLFFSLASSKLIWYIIPIYPPLAIINGRFLDFMFNLFFEKIAKVKRLTLKFIFSFVVLMFALSYLYIEKELVYHSDLTGKQADLIDEKEEKLGLKTKVYIDQVDYPVALFYSDGPFELVKFAPLLKKVATTDEEFIVITKESRFRRLKNENIDRDYELIKQNDEWVLFKITKKKESQNDFSIQAL